MSIQKFEPIAISSESTVVAEYESVARGSKSYQSEADLERDFIKTLKDQAYEYLEIKQEEDLLINLRKQLEKLNKIAFTDSEWERFFKESISSERDSILEKTKSIQEDHVKVLKRDNGEIKNISLIDKQNIHNNYLQVINQYEVEGVRKNRYDITVLVNGLPLVHIELKRRGVDIKEAFNQINRYQRDSFWAGTGLYEYIQIFVISNGTYTKYYSNTVRSQHIAESNGSTKVKKTSNSFEFTSWWADAKNKPIYDLISFAKTFFWKPTLLNVITRYCVFTADEMLLVMRPYQIVATERILQKIVISGNMNKLGSIDAGGYIWHTTGSGKTLTSFKTAQLACKVEGIEKVIFVVDRKDLDYQTMKEYDRFQEGAANSNVSTAILKKQLEDPEAKIIITTIQKLAKFISQNPKHEISKKRVILIFDECHRSQFGEMHSAIKKAFTNFNLFGFTGTPIFAINASTGNNPQLRTTEQAFGTKLHTYTIVDAITDKNVLPFRVDYINTFKLPENIRDKDVSAIDREEALLAPKRIEGVAQYILEHFSQKTRRNKSYTLRNKRVVGFNSLFATASIEAAKLYYATFKKLQSELPEKDRLKIGLIYSFAQNEDEIDGILADENFEANDLDKSSRDFLEEAIKDYNKIYKTNWSTSTDKFESYYKDLAMRMKTQDIDLVIVVNMFLTGFDSTTLNTLWVDKNLRLHGLIQAFSRTNRILNSVKTYGNIVCFRDLEENTKEAISIFGDKDAGGIVLLKAFSEYFDEYSKLISELTSKFDSDKPPVSEKEIKEFISLYNRVLRLRNILVSFDDFSGKDLLTEAQLQDYQSTYLLIYQDEKNKVEQDKESILEDIIFEIELVKQIQINVDYILMLVGDLQKTNGDQNKELRSKIDKTINSSFVLRSKKDLIIEFIDSINNQSDVEERWKEFIEAQKRKELESLIIEDNLDPEATKEFMEKSISQGELKTSGTSISNLLPARDIFSPNYEHSILKAIVIGKLQKFFERFSNL